MKIILLLGTDGADVRSAKILRSLARLGHDVHFVGWNRRFAITESVATGVHFHLMDMEVPFGKSTLWGQIKFSAFAAKKLRAIRPDVVCAVNEDNALRAILLRKLYFKYLICDLYDSHVDRFSEIFFGVRWPIMIAGLLCKSLVDRLVVTDRSRWERLGRFRRKAIIVENVPEDPGSHLSCQIPTGATKIFVTGTMNRNRGLEQIIQAIERCPDVKIVAAGRPSDSYAEEVFLKHRQVDYRGVVTPQQSLELAATCDAVFAFYAPLCDNHIYASPNKLFDAMSVGRPVIINLEVKMSRVAADTSVGLLCPYYDIDGLRNILKSLSKRRDQLPEFADKARQLYVKKHSWEIMEKSLGDLYETIDESRDTTRQAAA